MSFDVARLQQLRDAERRVLARPPTGVNPLEEFALAQQQQQPMANFVFLVHIVRDDGLGADAAGGPDTPAQYSYTLRRADNGQILATHVGYWGRPTVNGRYVPAPDNSYGLAVLGDWQWSLIWCGEKLATQACEPEASL